MNIQKKVLILLLISAAWMQAMDQDKNKAGVQRPALGWIDKTLIDACTHGNQLTATRALEWGARVNAQNSNGQTALHKAVIKSYYQSSQHDVQEFHERPELVQLLMHAGADCTIEDSSGVSPLSALRRNIPAMNKRIVNCVLRNMHRCKVTAHDPQEELGQITYRAFENAVSSLTKQENREQWYVLLYDSLRAGSDMTCQIHPYWTHDTIYAMARDCSDDRIKKMIADFQKEHSEHMKQAFEPKNASEPLLHASLYPLIFECLYPRLQEGMMTDYCKDLLSMPIGTQAQSDVLHAKLKRLKAVAADTLYVKDNQGNTALQLAVKQGNQLIIRLISDCLIEDLLKAIDNTNDNDVLKVVNMDPLGMYTNGVLIRRAIQRVDFWQKAKYTDYPNEDALNRALEILKVLCAAGVDLADRYVHDPELVVDCDEETGLEFAITGYGCGDVVKLLLYLGVDHTRPNSKTKKTPWEQADDPEIKVLLKNPKETLENLTDAEKREFADIKAEREKRLAAYKAAHNNFPAPAAGAGAGTGRD